MQTEERNIILNLSKILVEYDINIVDGNINNIDKIIIESNDCNLYKIFLKPNIKSNFESMDVEIHNFINYNVELKSIFSTENSVDYVIWSEAFYKTSDGCVECEFDNFKIVVGNSIITVRNSANMTGFMNVEIDNS